MFSIEIDKDRRIVRITAAGFWQVDEVIECLSHQQAAVLALRVRPGAHRLLVDVREMKIQTQDVVTRLNDVFCNAAVKAEKFAVIVAPGLVRQQVRRAVAGREIAMFDDEDSALDYLTGAESPTRTSRGTMRLGI